MTDEIATADSGADTIPVDNTNISVTDFANRRLGQLNSQASTEEEAEPVVEEETEETPEEVIEETQEAEEGEPEVESASEDVLSQIDLDNASEEELRELADKLGSKAVARFGELTARRKSAEEKLAKLEASLQQKDPLESKKKIENNPFGNLDSIEDLQSKAEEIEQIVDWAEDLLFEGADYAADDVITEIEGKEMTKAEVRKSLLQARKAKKTFIPDQLSKIQAKEQAKNMEVAFKERAKEELSWLDGEDNDIRKQYEATVNDARFQKMKEIVSKEAPDVAGQLDYWFAHAANSIYGRKPIAEDKPSMKLTPPKGATTSNANAAKSPSRTAKALKELQSQFKQSGNARDFAALRKLQMASRL
jgi:hypothetical protein